MSVSLATLMMTCAPLVHPTTLRALIQVESAGNPYAVSVNYPRSLHIAGADPPDFPQPHSRGDALALIARLAAEGFSTSVGLAQINVQHLQGSALHLADLFNPCVNLALAQRVLLDCDAQQSQLGTTAARLRLRRTLVCYNAGEGVSETQSPYASNIARAAETYIRAPVNPKGRE
jgi:type IV secretion system protein VirB1